MSFEKRNLSLFGYHGVKPEGKDKKGLHLFFYNADGDDTTAAEYFSEAIDNGYMVKEDLVYVVDDNAGTPILAYVDEDGTLQNPNVSPQA